MNENINRQTAQIIPFPVHRRVPHAASPGEHPVVELAYPMMIGEASYHQAAIEEERRNSRH